jgi:NAD(P)-dependent dehydrogenase (short-subunit alcohol dehydrogenase family)
MTEAQAYTLVTGASSGIGRAIAVRLSALSPLILHGRDAPRLEATRAACARSDTHLTWQCDFEDSANVASGLAQLLGRHTAGVAGFVHAAGIAHVMAARTAELKPVLESLAVNYISAQQIVATLIKKRVNPGQLRQVVFVSSIYSRKGVRGHSLYCGAKAALDGLMRALAVELAPGTRVNSVLPGAVKTPMAESAMGDPAIVARLQQDYPLGIGQPDDVAAVVEFLLSDAARWITGQEFVVDGGRLANLALK